MGDIGVVVEARRVVIDVCHRHRYGCRAGQAFGLSSICRHNQQLVIGPFFSVQQGAGDNLPCGWVDRKLPMTSGQTVTKKKRHTKGKLSVKLTKNRMLCSL